ncbi:AAA family ATPase, partial [Burkholderia pseudomallei]|uniref:AAA family ATPase n=3 Tax=Burkholderia TaxID=32008 RepID=UPI001B1BC584|nr:hypothetical protein [Burkholderia pseudomallei]
MQSALQHLPKIDRQKKRNDTDGRRLRVADNEATARLRMRIIYGGGVFEMAHSEIRESTKVMLREKVRNRDYGRYLIKASIGTLRGFGLEDISFDFPVTALIGPNGSGKSSVLGAAGCAYKPIKPGTF